MRRAKKAASAGATPGGVAAGRMVALDEARTADLQTLQGLIDGGKTLPSDRIRALEAKQRILAAASADSAVSEHAELLALKRTLDTLPPDARVHAITSVLRAESADPAERAEA